MNSIMIMDQTTTTEKVATPCDTCSGDCCKYFLLDYQRPDMSIPLYVDTLDWLGRHTNTTIISRNLTKRWARIMINNPCAYLGADNRCTDYDNRPMTCRKFFCPKKGHSIRDMVEAKVMEGDEY